MFQLHRLRVGTVHGLGVHRDERPSVRGPDLQLPSGQLPGDGAEPVPRQRLRRVQDMQPRGVSSGGVPGPKRYRV